MTAIKTARPQSNGHQWHAQYPELGTGPLPLKVFTSKEQFSLEREHIFRKVWLNVCRVEQLPNPGDYWVKDIGVCNTSVVVVRGRDGQLRAFHNMCSHRGNKLIWAQQGNSSAFTCKFHGWMYGLDGRLKFVPDEESFFDIKKDCLGLSPVQVDVWEGFVFINIDPDPQETLQEYLGEMAAQLTGYPFAECSATAFSWRSEVKANWKIVKDSFQEVYHVGCLHKRSLPDAFVSKDNPYTHVLDMKLFPRHGRASLFGNAAHQPSPVQALSYQHGSILVRNGFSEQTLPVGVNPTRSPDWSFELHVIFPAFFVVVSEGTYFTHQFWPLDVGRTIWESTTYFPKAKNLAQRFSQEYSRIIFRDIFMEDARTVEETQSVLSSGAKQDFLLQDYELLVRHSHNVVLNMIGGKNDGKTFVRAPEKAGEAHV